MGKKRLLLAAASLASIGAVVALATGVTFGFFSDSTSSAGSSFSAGKVSVNEKTDATCSIPGMVPGDESTGYTGADVTGNNQVTKDPSCTFSVKYTGTVPAFIGLKLSAPGTLYTGSEPGLQFQISDGTNSYTTSGALNSGELYVATDPGADNTYTFTVNYGLPTVDTVQGSTATTLNMQVAAVQAGNNGFATTNGLSGGTACTPGTVCAGIGAWS